MFKIVFLKVIYLTLIMNYFKKYIRENFSNFTYFYSILRSRLLIVIGFSILVGLLDSIGLTMFLPLLQLADGSDKSVDLGNLSFITDVLNFVGIKLTIPKVLFFLVFIFFIKGFVLYKSNVYKILAQQQLTKNIRMTIVNKLPLFSYSQFLKTDLGKIQNIFIGEIGRLSITYNGYVSMIQGIFMIVMYMFFSFLTDWKFAILVCLGGLISNLVFNKINKLTKEKSKHISLVSNQFAGSLIQYIQNFKYLKATGKILKYKDLIAQDIDKVQMENLKIGILNSKVSSFREPLLIFIVAIVILVQVSFYNANIGAIMISLLFFYRALTSIVSVQSNYNNTISNQGAIDNLISFLKEIDNNKDAVGLNKFDGFIQNINLKNISFSFENKVILNDINLTIPKNKSIAFVGESGSGKTTLVNIINKLLNPASGEVTIDGVQLSSFNQFTYQNKIGYISQETAIFNDTIFNNVTFWSEKTPENLLRFQKATKAAAISEFIESLENKENTKLGINGLNLSGGQRQRISIARELFRDVEILILDEATSALDSQTEQEIQNSIDNLKGKITIISIAHRLSTIKNVDIIYLIDRGQLVASGDFDELLNKSNHFKKMVKLQEL